MLVARGQEIWRDRFLVLSLVADPEFGPVVRADLLDFILAWVHLRLAGAEGPERAELLWILNATEEILGPNAAIDRERASLLGRPDSSIEPLQPKSAREFFDLGQSYLRSGATSKAADQFRLGLRLRPQDFWLNFYLGLTAYRLGQFDEAGDAFRVAIALAPDSAECSYNRALALGALGRSDDAVADYTRALELNPSLGVAAMNRGILHYQNGRLDEASRDLNRALGLTSVKADAGLIHYNLALVELARQTNPKPSPSWTKPPNSATRPRGLSAIGSNRVLWLRRNEPKNIG